MSGGGSEDIYVNLDRLKEYAQWCQRHLDAMEVYIEDSGRGPLREASRDGSRFGGFIEAKNLAALHAQLTNDMRELLYEIRGGIETAQLGVEQTIKKYHGTDDQQSREFKEIDESKDDEAG